MIQYSNKNNIKIYDKKITVIGLGISGKAAAQLANYLGAKVFASDSGDNKAVNSNAMDLMQHHIASETGIHSDQIFDSDLWIISPGVPKDCKIVKKALGKGIPIVSEIEFASWFTKTPIIAITGSNGKTTTTNIISQMCNTDNLNGIIAGNFGASGQSCVAGSRVIVEKKIASTLIDLIKQKSQKFAGEKIW